MFTGIIEELGSIERIDHSSDAARLTIATRAHLPVVGAEDAEIVAFRTPEMPGEHIALLIGEPDGRPPLVRLHSECLTGDMLGSPRSLFAFARELLGHAEVGVLARLVHSRFGLHIVEVLEREPGVAQPFEAVRGAVAMSLRQQAFVTALRQYLSLRAGAAKVEGVELDAADTPLVQ